MNAYEESVLCRAEAKRTRIIARGGDLSGERRQPWYLEALADEIRQQDYAAAMMDGSRKAKSGCAAFGV